MKFLLFADFHYQHAAYASTVDELNVVMQRAADNDVDFVIHAGDFCNDYVKSPEALRAYLDNPHGLAVYGVYGNHELEWVTHDRQGLDKSNPMERVTPYLSNRADDIVWGTADGKIGDGSIGYYYFDCKGFRIVCTDTNYSYSPERDAWEHNKDYFRDPANKCGDSLGTEQLNWLEDVLTDAAKQGIPCIVVGHAGYCAHWNRSGQNAEVREIYSRVNAIRKGTVRMSINGHYHTQRSIVEDNILYWDQNSTVHAIMYISTDGDHYTDEHTYTYTEYDAEGNPIKTYEAPYSKCYRGQFGYHFSNPISAIITLGEDGSIAIEGAETDFKYGVRPLKENWEDIAGKMLGTPSMNVQLDV